MNVTNVMSSKELQEPYLMSINLSMNLTNKIIIKSQLLFDDKKYPLKCKYIDHKLYIMRNKQDLMIIEFNRPIQYCGECIVIYQNQNDQLSFMGSETMIFKNIKVQKRIFISFVYLQYIQEKMPYSFQNHLCSRLIKMVPHTMVNLINKLD